MLPPPLPFPPQEDIPAKEPRIRHKPNRLIFPPLRMRSAKMWKGATTQVGKGPVASKYANSHKYKSRPALIKPVCDGAHVAGKSIKLNGPCQAGRGWGRSAVTREERQTGRQHHRLQIDDYGRHFSTPQCPELSCRLSLRTTAPLSERRPCTIFARPQQLRN